MDIIIEVQIKGSVFAKSWLAYITTEHALWTQNNVVIWLKKLFVSQFLMGPLCYILHISFVDYSQKITAKTTFLYFFW